MRQLMASVNSYLPPPSGDHPQGFKAPAVDSKPYPPPKDIVSFPPNVQPSYLPPKMKAPQAHGYSYAPPASISEPASSTMYIPPKDLHNFPPNIQSSYLPPGMKQLTASVNSYLPPPSGTVSGFYDGSKPNFPGPMPMQMVPMPMPMAPPTMGSAPSGPDPMMDMQPPMDAPMDHDHHHHDHDHSAPDYPKWYGSDIIYDYDPHHHHHHHHEEPPPETTTATEAPEEPRVKKYSYYYLGRKLWYIPLYFTLWFCLYVAALIIRSIGRHKVN